MRFIKTPAIVGALIAGCSAIVIAGVSSHETTWQGTRRAYLVAVPESPQAGPRPLVGVFRLTFPWRSSRDPAGRTPGNRPGEAPFWRG